MVAGTRTEGGAQILSAGVRKTIQSIKEIVGNHSDADIYVALKETNMDPNETAQKLLNQDPFHEVKRRRDKRKEPQNQNSAYRAPADPQQHIENVDQGMKFRASSRRFVRRGGLSRNSSPGISREFRVVRDNRVNGNTKKEVKPPSQQSILPANEQLVSNTSEKGSSATSSRQKPFGARSSSQVSNGSTDSHRRHSVDANSRFTDKKAVSLERRGMATNGAVRVQPVKPNNFQQNSMMLASSSPVVGVYSSSTDPVHVPSPDSRSSGAVGAIRREVGVVGVRRQSFDNSVKQSSVPSNSFANDSLPKDGPSSDSLKSSNAISKTEEFGRTAVTESSIPSMTVGRPFPNNQYNSRQHQQIVGHQKGSQTNKEWKPKFSQKSSGNSLGVIGTPTKSASPAAENSRVVESDTTKLQNKLSQVTLCENQNVIIAQHIRVAETARCCLTFGTIGTEIDSSRDQSKLYLTGTTETPDEEPPSSSSAPTPESSGDVSGSKKVNLFDNQGRSTDSDSPASSAASKYQMPDNQESSSPQNLDNYADIGLVQEKSPSYLPSESRQQHDPHELPGFSAYDPQTGYDIPYFRPGMDETVRGHGLLSPPEALGSHTANNILASTVSMMQQQQPPVAQMYPQVHVSHFTNLMPYRQYLSPVYVPPMAMPGYSSNTPYPHPSNGSSYLLMPGGSSHLNASNLKYGVQQFKPVPAGSTTGFGNFTNPTGYAINAPGVVGSAAAIEDSSRIKYKDGNLYVPNPQAETSEIWVQNPRELPAMQSAQYYNLPGQASHAAYMPSHTGHASYNAAAAQSSHMQFPGMYHPPPQPAAIASPHHLGAAMGSNVGVGVGGAAPGAQLGAYQQPQLGHLNWTTNF
ncbi:GBF-interacting protein 1 [Quillaja saponaria]|uniref:GBF-interacting protein 1 n=1 Tax=Quillaja saponaria TaxID=32244 RepID=A0AAD7LS99_QUISA|nr:GBF-interacting protein 1 [Quillaja saponaria]